MCTRVREVFRTPQSFLHAHIHGQILELVLTTELECELMFIVAVTKQQFKGQQVHFGSHFDGPIHCGGEGTMEGV